MQISNPHQAYLAAACGTAGPLWSEVVRIYRDETGAVPDPPVVADALWRLGGWRLAQSSPPSRALADTDALRAELSPMTTS